MKSVESRFNEVSDRYPYWSSYICFFEAIKNQKFSKKIIRKWFYKLVDEDDYFKEDGNTGLIGYLYAASNPVKGDKSEVVSIKNSAEAGYLEGKIAV